MKPVLAISIEHYESLLKQATEDSPLYFRLKNAVKMATPIVVRCDRRCTGNRKRGSESFNESLDSGNLLALIGSNCWPWEWNNDEVSIVTVVCDCGSKE
jgi:hypothetical protein